MPHPYLSPWVNVKPYLEGHHVVLPGDGVGGPIQAEGVVLAYLPLLFEAEDVVQVQPVEGLEGRGGFSSQGNAPCIPVKVAGVIPANPALELGIELFQGAGGMLWDEALLDEAEQSLDLALGLGIAWLMG